MSRDKRKTNSVDFGSVSVVVSDMEETGEEEEEEENGAMGYQQTLMYGRYSKSLGEEVKKRQKIVEKLRLREVKKRKHETELKGIAGQINDTIAMYETQEAEIEMSRRQEAYV